ncbi:MAG: reverse transcriptase-like protein [Acidobacteria bacterium]|nr:reverse transcriptase-like protein [Acidobacteriota bacterium]
MAPATGKTASRLFDDTHAAPPADWMLATIDGAARGNPGPAAYGVVFEDAAGRVRAQLAARIGKATNNVAEYRGLLAALAYARQQGWRALRVRTDSELLARQLNGDYRVRSADLKPLHAEARRLIAGFDYFAVEAVPRKLTRPADKLANAALDKRPVRSGQRPERTKASGHGLSRAEKPPRKSGGSAPEVKQTIRAVYENGVLKPLESLDLPDGTEVELSLRRPAKE